MPEIIIPNPIEIAFDPFAVEEKYGDIDGGVPMADIFNIPIARIFWLTYKSTHLTNQYFRPAVMRSAELTYRKPPRIPQELVVWNFNGGLSSFLHSWKPFQEAIFQFIIWQLMQENRWPYFVPSSGIRELKYIIDTRPKVRRWCNICNKYFMKVAPYELVTCSDACQREFDRVRRVTGKHSRMVSFEDPA